MKLSACVFLALVVAGVAQQRPPKPPREAREEREEAQEILVECRLAGKTPEECRQQFGNSTAMPPPDRVKERFELEKGAPRAILGALENCTMDIGKAGLSVTFEDCKMQIKALLEQLKNETVSPEELEGEIRKIAGEKAKHIVSACSEAASTDAAKEACLSSTEALEALAKLSGRAVEDVPAEELRALFRRGAAEEISEELRLCMGSADTDAKEKECFGSDDIKATIGESMGKGKDNVKDSDIREFLEEGVKEEIWTLLESCPEDSKETCMASAKDMLAAVTGQESAAISDDMIRKLLNDEMASELGARMRACMDSAEDDTAKASCRTTLSADMLGVAGGRGGTPSATDVGEALKEAGRDKAKEVSKDCQGSREECMEKLKEEAAKSMGRSKEDLSDMEVERLNLDGARDAAKEAARGCAAARKESAEATCADPTEVFASARKVPIEDDVDRNRIRQDLVKETEKDAMRTCMAESDKTGFDRCMGEMKDADEVAGELFKGLSAERKQNKEKRAKDEAAIEVVGERFQICMESSTTEEEKKACQDEMRNGAGMAGLTEDVEDVVKKYHRNVVATAARACNQTARKACIDQAKEELKKSGLKERAFHVVRQLAEMKSAAEIWAACQEDSVEANATCDSLAKAELEEISGSMDVWTAEMAAKVKALGEAMLEGREVVLRKLRAVLVELLTDALDCSDAVLDKVAEMASGISETYKPNASAPRNVSNKECRIVWGLARYKCKIQTPDLNDTETDEVSELLSTDLLTTNINVRRLGRRLAVITDSYAAQEEEETIAGTGTGGDGDDGTDGDGDNDGDDAGDHASTSHGLLTAAYSVSAALLSLLFV